MVKWERIHVYSYPNKHDLNQFSYPMTRLCDGFKDDEGYLSVSGVKGKDDGANCPICEACATRFLDISKREKRRVVLNKAMAKNNWRKKK